MPVTKERIDEPRDVRRLRFTLEGADLSAADLDGGSQTVVDAASHIIEVRDPQTLSATPADLEARRYLAPEPLIESDDPAIRAEAATRRAAASPADARSR